MREVKMCSAGFDAGYINNSQNWTTTNILIK